MLHLLCLCILLLLTTLDAAVSPSFVLFRSTVNRSLALPHNEQQGTVVTRSDRTGPLGNVFRVTISTTQNCTANATHTCRSSKTPFAMVGDARYSFNDSGRNIRGQSTQTMRACRCITADCSQAILMTPVAIVDETGTVVNHTVLYEREQESTGDGKFTDCFATVAHVQSEWRGASQPNQSVAHIQYSVNNGGDQWRVSAYRGSIPTCTEADVSNAEFLDVSTVKETFEETISTFAGTTSTSPCKPQPGRKLYRSNAADSKVAIELFKRAADMAGFQTSQQDCQGNGKTSRTYLNPPSAQLASRTDLALACSAAVLGALLLTAMSRDWLRRRKLLSRLPQFLTAQLLYVALETLPLFVVLFTEIQAMRWRSLLAFVDVALARPAGDGGDMGVMVLSTVIGDVRHFFTGVVLIAALTAFFIVFNVVVACYVLAQALRSNGSGEVVEEDGADVKWGEGDSVVWKRAVAKKKRRRRWRVRRSLQSVLGRR